MELHKENKENDLEEYVPGRVGGRYDDMFNRDTNETINGNDGISNNSVFHSSTHLIVLVESAWNRCRNIDWRYIRNGIGEILDEHKTAVWILLSFLLFYKFLF